MSQNDQAFCKHLAAFAANFQSVSGHLTLCIKGLKLQPFPHRLHPGHFSCQGICQLLHACDSRTHEAALFQNIFKFCTFLPKSSNILPSFALFFPFSERSHACRFFEEQALHMMCSLLYLSNLALARFCDMQILQFGLF